jgi:hypothetical protein
VTSLEALAIVAVISLVVSALLCAAIFQSLQALLGKICPGPEVVTFWTRFTLIMLFLSPLFVATAFGLPPATLTAKMDPGDLLQRVTVATLVGAFLAMLGMGLWVSALIRRAPFPPMSQRREEEWGDRHEK